MPDFNSSCNKILDKKYIYKHFQKKIVGNDFLKYVGNKKTKKTETKKRINELKKFIDLTLDGGLKSYYENISNTAIDLIRDGHYFETGCDPDNNNAVTGYVNRFWVTLPKDTVILRKNDKIKRMYMDFYESYSDRRDSFNWASDTAGWSKAKFSFYNENYKQNDVYNIFYTDKNKMGSFSVNGKKIDLDLYNKTIFKIKITHNSGKTYEHLFRVIKVTYDDYIDFYNSCLEYHGIKKKS